MALPRLPAPSLAQARSARSTVPVHPPLHRPEEGQGPAVQVLGHTQALFPPSAGGDGPRCSWGQSRGHEGRAASPSRPTANGTEGRDPTGRRGRAGGAGEEDPALRVDSALGSPWLAARQAVRARVLLGDKAGLGLGSDRTVGGWGEHDTTNGPDSSSSGRSPSRDDRLARSLPRACAGGHAEPVESRAQLPRRRAAGCVSRIHGPSSAVCPASADRPGVRLSVPQAWVEAAAVASAGFRKSMQARRRRQDDADAAMDVNRSRLGPRRRPSCSEQSGRTDGPRRGRPACREREPLSCWCPAVPPPQTLAARVRNQALMRIFGVSPGPTPRPTPAASSGGRVRERRGETVLFRPGQRGPRVYRILVKRLSTDTDSCGAHGRDR